MGTYDKTPTKHVAAAVDFGAGTTTHEFVGPKGKRGLLVNYGVEDVTETFTNTTTAANVAVGTTSDADAYGEEFSLGTVSDAAGGVSVLSTYRRGSDEYEDYVLPGVPIPADTVVRLTCTAPTGGTPAGIAAAFAEIIWEA
jgi:hypothetical protein